MAVLLQSQRLFGPSLIGVLGLASFFPHKAPSDQRATRCRG